MAGESYTSPVTGETYTVPSYTDPADAPIAFKDFADTITGGGGIDIPATRVDAVVQTLDGSTWSEGMALSVVAAVPADTEGQIGDVVFVAGKSPAPSGAAKLSAITGTGTTHVDGDFVAYEFIDDGTVTVSDHGFLTEALIVGGGGGGGGVANNFGGGGGAGSHLLISSAFLSAESHVVTVGDGGAAGIGQQMSYSGEPSRLGDFYSIGGGNCDSHTEANTGTPGGPGGSGGGGSGGSGNHAGGAGTAGLGNNGGSGVNGTNQGAGGGGGAVSPGSDGVGTDGGNGGDGISSSINGTATLRSGGGGGAGSGVLGLGGSGGGGDAASTGIAGVVNTGSGGGGSTGSTGGAGGSGVVIIRIPAASVVGIDKSGWTEVSTGERQIAEAKRVAKQTAALKKAAVKEAAKEATTTDIEETE